MRTRLLVGAIASVAVAMVAAACGDLFHSTDFDTLCTLDAQAPRCVDGSTKPDASDAGAPDAPLPSLCAAGSTEALARAKRACALLGACETPIGQNKAGLCLANAILAYDCTANPNRPPIAESATFWQCMAAATTCGAVDSCEAPGGKYTGCTTNLEGCLLGVDGGALPGNANTRVECFGGKAHYENCTAYGQLCSVGAGNMHSQCTGPQAFMCSASGCQSGEALSLCDDAGDHGLECAQVGGATCLGVGASVGCKPSQTVMCDGGASGGVTCNGGNTATSCVTGFQETVDCTVLTGPGSCLAIPPALAPLGVTPDMACVVAPGCAGDACGNGSTANILHACVHGAVVDIDCADAGLAGGCGLVSTVDEGASAACKP